MKRLIRTSLLLMATALFAACTNDIVPQKGETKKPATTYVATFTGSQPKTTGEAKTRTTATHTRGGAAQVYWETTDRIWVKADDGTFQQSEPAQYQPYTPVNKSLANFALTTGSFTKPNLEVRYTNTGRADRVTIAANQTQASADDFSHLGTAGDCGTATSQGSNGNYTFTLNHKASYLCFVPRNLNIRVAGAGSYDLGPNIKLTKITVKADKPIAGTYDFSDGTLKDKTPTGGSNTITLTPGGEGFSMNTQTEKLAVNGAYMVIAPGTYNLTIAYTITDPTTHITTDIVKTLPGFNCPEGQIRDMKANLTFKQCNYWDCQTLRHIVQPSKLYQLPNANEMYWYTYKGDPHWEENVGIYAVDGHLHMMNGMWFKKKAKILADEGITEAQMQSGYPKESPLDYRTTKGTWPPISILPQTTPVPNKADYFFLPAFGRYVWPGGMNPSVLKEFNSYGRYWSKDMFPDGSGWNIYHIIFSKDKVRMGCSPSGVSFDAWNFETGESITQPGA